MDVLLMAACLALILLNLKLNKDTLAARDAFLQRARQVMPKTVQRDHDMHGIAWRFWRWAKQLDAPEASDAQLLAHARRLRELGRQRLANGAATGIVALALLVHYLQPFEA